MNPRYEDDDDTLGALDDDALDDRDAEDDPDDYDQEWADQVAEARYERELEAMAGGR